MNCTDIFIWLQAGGGEKASDASAGEDENLPSRHTALTVALLGTQYLAALAIPTLKAVFALTGAVPVVGFCFAFPVIFALKLLSSRTAQVTLALSTVETWAAWLVLLLSCVLGAWSLAVTVSELALD